MKISFSRKGFDSSAGGAPSPIIGGQPISLPIPTHHRSVTTYKDLGLSGIVDRVTRGRLSGAHLCHRDPMFQDSRCAFGQVAAAQTHLENHNFGPGDIFLFYGLFADENGRDRHHRIFGYLRVSEKHVLGAEPVTAPLCLDGFQHTHPHTIAGWNENNTLYFGRGNVARTAAQELRLSKPGTVSTWHIPQWLREATLSFHSDPARWQVERELRIVSRGQEFVTEDIGHSPEARAWVEDVIQEIERAS